MIKTEYGHFSAPFFQEKFDNGLNVLFFPRKSKLNCAYLYLPCGSFPHEEQIEGVKTPYGSAYLLQHLVLTEARKKEFMSLGTLATSSLDYSYTLFRLSSFGDIFPSVSKLLDVFLKQDFKEEEIEAFKKENQESLLSLENDPLYLTSRGLLENLYETSPIRMGIQPLFKDVNVIHRSALRNHVLKYTAIDKMTLFLGGNMEVKEVEEKVSALKVNRTGSLLCKPIVYQEMYDRVKCPYTEKHVRGIDSDYLSFGIKFAKRQQLYESFGQLLFEFYEILIPALFTENQEFLKGLVEVGARLVDSKIHEAGEDGCLILTFRCKGSTSLVKFLTDYVSKLERRLTAKDFKAVVNDYYAKGLVSLSLPNTALDEFSRIYADNLSYTGILNALPKMGFNTFRNFLSKMDHFPKAAFFLGKVL